VRRGPLELRTQDIRRVTISSHTADPLQLAIENRAYPLRFVFIIHPWFSQGELHQNFAGFVDIFTRELASLAFLSFRDDASLVLGVPRSDATKLLSGIAFLNGWPPSGTDAEGPRPFCRIYLNPIATHRLRRSSFVGMESVFRDDLRVDEIADNRPPDPSQSRRLAYAIAATIGVLLVGLIIWMLTKGSPF
jgi:hypothetical protein